MMMKGPIREIIPVGKQVVSVALPAGMTGAAVRLLVSGVSPRVSVGGGRVEIEVPQIVTNEVVLIDFAR